MTKKKSFYYFWRQTFRQKAHLQRHETTHGLGAKVHRSPGAQNASGGGFSNPKRKRKRSRGANNSSSVVVVTSAGNSTATLGGNIILPNTPVSANSLSDNLQRRLAHVSEKFGGNPDSMHRGDEEDMDDEGHEGDSRDGEEVTL
jgi:hypothetical protein